VQNFFEHVSGNLVTQRKQAIFLGFIKRLLENIIVLEIYSFQRQVLTVFAREYDVPVVEKGLELFKAVMRVAVKRC
jgi:hypothetical protein